MDIGQLRYFSKIVEYRSFTRAAQDFSVSQPALSQQIAKLEKELGQPLFERQGRTIRMTPAGALLKNRAEEILRLVDDAKREITDDGQTGRICIAGTPTIVPFVLPHLLDEVGSQFPNAQIIVNEETTETVLEQCARGDVDLGLVTLPVSGKYLDVEPLFDEEIFLALPVDHRLCKNDRIGVKEIAKESFVLLNSTHRLGDIVEEFFNRKGIQLSIVSRVEQLATIKQLVAKGQGLSCVPRMATEDDLDGRIVYRSLRGDKPSRQVAICWNPYRFQSQLQSNFLKGILEFSGTFVGAAVDVRAKSVARKRVGSAD